MNKELTGKAAIDQRISQALIATFHAKPEWLTDLLFEWLQEQGGKSLVWVQYQGGSATPSSELISREFERSLLYNFWPKRALEVNPQPVRPEKESEFVRVKPLTIESAVMMGYIDLAKARKDAINGVVILFSSRLKNKGMAYTSRLFFPRRTETIDFGDPEGEPVTGN